MSNATAKLITEKAESTPAALPSRPHRSAKEQAMNGKDKSEVVVPAQQEVRAYLNTAGDIVFERDLDDFEIYSADQSRDVAIFIPRFYVPRLIDRLKTLMAEGG